jgi:hypothetical protein
MEVKLTVFFCIMDDANLARRGHMKPAILRQLFESQPGFAYDKPNGDNPLFCSSCLRDPLQTHRMALRLEQ